MTKQTNTIPANRNALIGGLILIFGGALAFAGQIVPDSWGLGFGLLVLLGLGLSFIFAGLLTREAGWFIPGGILTGIGVGIALVDGPLARLIPAGLLPGDEGGLFMLAFAGGWFLISVLTALFSDGTHWWPLIPGGIMLLIGLAAGFGSIFGTVLSLVGNLWPIALIAAGLYVLYQARRGEKQPTDDVPQMSDGKL
ncbi:MAG: hypothetical protein KBG73_12235 [Candidatus Promineofilum sp.]|nr:hypothetical protein [Promineifilum sp.]